MAKKTDGPRPVAVALEKLFVRAEAIQAQGQDARQAVLRGETELLLSNQEVYCLREGGMAADDPKMRRQVLDVQAKAKALRAAHGRVDWHDKQVADLRCQADKVLSEAFVLASGRPYVRSGLRFD